MSEDLKKDSPLEATNAGTIGSGLAFSVDMGSGGSPQNMPKSLQQKLLSPKREITKEDLDEKQRKVEERKQAQNDEKSKERQKHLAKVKQISEKIKTNKKLEMEEYDSD